ncbi:MAG: hypothetical protein O7A04_08045 [Acidobacteria bacterium]|nr:hypothetical protein [Acidobacteriota bacterium]
MLPPRRLDERTAEAASGSVASVLTLLGFGLLVLAGFVVFLVLPGWVEDDPFGTVAAEPPARTERGRAAAAVAVEEPVAATVERGLRPLQSAPLAADSRDTIAGVVEKKPRPQPPEDPFAVAMSTGLGALDRGDFTTAQEAFREANRLQPESSLVKDALARTATGLRQTAILDLRQSAGAHADREEWVRAGVLYAEVLTLDGTVAFAVSGRRLALWRAELSVRIEGYLGRPDRLSSENVLAEATTTLREAEEVEQPGPRLESQSRRLAQLVSAYSTPMRARLRSDNETAVVVYRVGQLGTFESRELELRPGRYVVVGSRAGYRDVRLTLTVEPGVEPPPLVIRCEEEI